MAIANVVNIICFNLNEQTYFPTSTGNNSMFTHIISVTLISRLMLNLKSLDERRHKVKASTSIASRAEHPEFTTHVSRYATWMQTHVVDAFALRTLTDSAVGTTTVASSLDIGHYYMDSDDDDADDEESLEDDEIELRSVTDTKRASGQSQSVEAWSRRYSDCESYKSYETVYGFAY